ncbi:MAG: redox-regulated ATPase YchF [Anaerolineales bacterium]|nr:redox-regulated ATPase YchF [Chloroflexota bacterium]MBL6981298.1 redox-regulated ATPase YchF [Anaerolineales bacterium]
MKLGIIGLPQSGKTTIFNALTRGDHPVTMSGGRFEVHTAVVDVPDPRVDDLSKLFNPKKTTYAKVAYADIAGLEGAASGDISGQLLSQLSQMDGFIHVVRCFDEPNVPHVMNSIDPQRDIDTMEGEFILNDLIQVEKKLERLAEELDRNSRDKTEVKREMTLFERIQAFLNEEKSLRTVEFTPDEEWIISGYGFLSLKEMLIVLNLGEDQEVPEIEYSCHSCVVSLRGRLEMEISQLSLQDAEIFMEEYDISEPSLNRMIRSSYDLMRLQSFFTVGEDEVRAWTVRRGAAAREAAGVIHSDLQKGFIRAEVVPYQDLLSLGSMPEARSKGKLRLEGKDYHVRDGDIMHVRFNV